jgi:hypothetical protein
MAGKTTKKKTKGVVANEATLTVTTTAFKQTVEEVQKLKVRPFAENAAVGRVAVGLGRTINLGNWESAKVYVSFEVPGYREELVNLYHQTMKVAEGKIGEKVKEIESSFGITSDEKEESIEGIL